jgi:hypothetical protein
MAAERAGMSSASSTDKLLPRFSFEASGASDRTHGSNGKRKPEAKVELLAVRPRQLFQRAADWSAVARPGATA